VSVVANQELLSRAAAIIDIPRRGMLGFGAVEKIADGGDRMAIDTLSYSVPGVSCAHCQAAIGAEVGALSGVASVDVALDARRVTVAGQDLDDGAIRAAIDEAGYDVEG
jgi:copper chaperone